MAEFIRKGRKPDEKERMLILKAGYDPFVWNILEDKKDYYIIKNRIDLQVTKIDK